MLQFYVRFILFNTFSRHFAISSLIDIAKHDPLLNLFSVPPLIRTLVHGRTFHRDTYNILIECRNFLRPFTSKNNETIISSCYFEDFFFRAYISYFYFGHLYQKEIQGKSFSCSKQLAMISFR